MTLPVVGVLSGHPDRRTPCITGSLASFAGQAQASAIAQFGAAPGGRPFSPQNFFVTIGGMHAIEIATRLIVGPGDEALIPTPAWPNFVGALEISGARPVPVPLHKEGRWSLDPAKLEKAVTPKTVEAKGLPLDQANYAATSGQVWGCASS